MKVLITGGAGFIGLNLTALLEASGSYQIRVLDNFSLGSRENLQAFDVEVVEGDILNEDAVEKVVDGMEAVIHLAADTRVMDSIENPAHNFRVNVNGTVNVLNSARNHKIRNVVFASTGGAILGDATPPVHEQMLPRPVSPYGASKLCGEAYCSAFSGAYGLKTVALRFSNVYGPRSYHKGSVVAHFFKLLMAGKELVVYGDGTQTRDYVFVDDICKGIVRALRSEQSGVYQLGTGVPTTVNELIGLMRRTVGNAYPVKVRHAGFREGEVRDSWCNIQKAREELGYIPAIDLPDGLQQTFAWFRDNAALLKAA